MKTLKKLSVLFIALLFVSCNNDDSNSSNEEKANILISSGSTSEGLFITNNFLDKVVFSSGYKETYVYNEENKVEKITSYKPDNTILYTVDFVYNSSGEIDFLKKEFAGYQTYLKATFDFSNPDNITILRENYNVSDNTLYSTDNIGVYTLVLSNNNIVTITNGLGSQKNYSYSPDSSVYNNLNSLKELSIFSEIFRTGGLETISDLNLSSSTIQGQTNTYQYEYNSDGKVSKKITYNSSLELISTITYEYN